jgi:hypothetical protein
MLFTAKSESKAMSISIGNPEEEGGTGAEEEVGSWWVWPGE